MKTFRLKTDLTIEAHDVDHVFMLISRYFGELAENGESDILDVVGEVEIEDVDEARKPFHSRYPSSP